MTWRERISYLVSAAISAAVLGVICWLLSRSAAGDTAPAAALPEEAPVVVAVVVPKADEKKPEPTEKEGTPNTATAQKGMNDTPTVPMEKPTPEPMKEKPPETPMGEPVPMKAEPTKPEPSELGNLDGVVPVIKYTGQVDALSRRYPRREVCWALDRTAPAGTIRITHEFVLTNDGQLAYRREADDRHFGDFTLSVGGYDTTQVQKIDDPTPLRLFGHRDAIQQIAGVSPSEGRRLLYWGHYRKKGEVELLGPVVEAFHAAVKEGKVRFDPSRPDRLEVQIGDEAGQPVVRAVFFSPADGPTVRLR